MVAGESVCRTVIVAAIPEEKAAAAAPPSSSRTHSTRASLLGLDSLVYS